jgi:hypothetical protein
MGNEGAYILKGYGQIDPNWMLRFFSLFKQQQVNIRKLILLKNGHPACFSMLEVHFIPPSGESQVAFLQKLDQHLALQSWQTQSVKPIE